MDNNTLFRNYQIKNKKVKKAHKKKILKMNK